MIVHTDDLKKKKKNAVLWVIPGDVRNVWEEESSTQHLKQIILTCSNDCISKFCLPAALPSPLMFSNLITDIERGEPVLNWEHSVQKRWQVSMFLRQLQLQHSICRYNPDHSKNYTHQLWKTIPHLSKAKSYPLTATFAIHLPRHNRQ